MQRAELAGLEADLSQLHLSLRLAGMAAGILRGPELIWFKGFGFADLAEKTKVTRDTPFHLASLTKTVASTLLMQLVERGELDLDAPAEAFGIVLKGHGTITVRHLFSHTSSGRPGERFLYDGSRFGQLEKVFLRTTRRNFAFNLDEIVIRPLGLRNTGQMYDSFETKLASPYKLDSAGNLVQGAYPTCFDTSAGLVASVSDYARYITAMNNGRFLKPQTQAVAFTPTKSTHGHVLPYGLGWFLENIQGKKTIWHYGHWDSMSSLVLMIPELDLTGIAVANSDGLSRGYNLACGRVVSSPIARAFLGRFFS